LGAAQAVAVSSCTAALGLALEIGGVGPGDEVITTPITFPATANVIVHRGARPVFADVERATGNIAIEEIARRITPRTKAIIPVHLFGQSADLEPILAAAARAGAAVIEDAAQAIGATYQDRAVGGWGAIGCFSFFPTKNLGALGDGGLVTTGDEALAHRLRLLRNHGMEPKYCHTLVGGNFRLDALQAAVLRVKLPHLAAWSAARRRNAGRYRRLFEQANLCGTVGLPAEAPGRSHVYNQFVVRVPEREALRRHLASREIGTEVYYPTPFHLQPCFANLGYGAGAFPHAERAAAESLALPVHGAITEAQQSWVVGSVRGFYEGRGR
jgi:dTDP-4-amino-4,6-dideoxygalactose transaminase